MEEIDAMQCLVVYLKFSIVTRVNFFNNRGGETSKRTNRDGGKLGGWNYLHFWKGMVRTDLWNEMYFDIWTSLHRWTFDLGNQLY